MFAFIFWPLDYVSIFCRIYRFPGDTPMQKKMATMENYYVKKKKNAILNP